MIGRFIGDSLELIIHSCQQITQLRPNLNLNQLPTVTIWSTAIWHWHFIYNFTPTGYSGKIPSSGFHLQKHDTVNLSTAMSAVYMHVHNVLLIYRLVWVTTTLYCSFLPSGGQIFNCMFTLPECKLQL